MTPVSDERKALALALGLALLTLLLFLPAIRGEFINCDDPVYLTDNPAVAGGLTSESVRWAWSAARGGHWHPLTWLSHLADVQLFGLHPRGHHFTNVLLHALNAGLCLLAFRALTGGLWRSLALALLWAWHPLRVESVAWVAERKDLLSGFFWLAAIWSYAGYARTHRIWRYALTLLLFALGLMSKPMILTLPFVLLLLDLWPLQRARLSLADAPAWGRLAREKIPFLILTFLSSLATVWAARLSGAVVSTDAVPLTARAANALVSYARYVAKWVWPIDLAVYYPFPDSPEWNATIIAAVVLAGTTVVVLLRLARQGYLVTGWFCFLGILVPVIGVVQAGAQAMADRFSYLPSLGLGLMITWSIADWASSRAWARRAVPIATGLVAIALALVTLRQIAFWADSITLFTRATEVTRRNFFAEGSLGEALLEKKRYPQAIEHLRRALEFDPKNFSASANLGNAHFEQGNWDEALRHYRFAEGLEPENAGLNWMLGQTLMRQQKLDEAGQAFRRVLAAAPGHIPCRKALAEILTRKGQIAAAIEELAFVVQAQPSAVELRLQLASLLAAAGRPTEAVREYRHILSLTPKAPVPLNNLAWLLATHPDPTVRNGAEAVRLAERACELVGQREAFLIGTLSAAYAEAGRFEEAARASTRAIALAEQHGQTEVVDRNRKLLVLFKASQPHREDSTNTPARWMLP